ncbi:DJ-1/PfpI family protein [Massilia sp. H-1]|nr:DJ-1/PfpI family protein [Massilia sp. H-1]
MGAASAWTVGICNGVVLLGAAGMLAGQRVTTNYFAHDQVRAFGAAVLPERHVRDGLAADRRQAFRAASTPPSGWLD